MAFRCEDNGRELAEYVGVRIGRRRCKAAEDAQRIGSVWSVGVTSTGALGVHPGFKQDACKVRWRRGDRRPITTLARLWRGSRDRSGRSGRLVGRIGSRSSTQSTDGVGAV